MNAAFYEGAGRFALRPNDPVPPGPGEVRLRPAYCGICGTDRHIFHGKMDARVRPPQVIGHEMSGVVVEVGAGVADWIPGDRVVVRPLDWCGQCPACRAGQSHICMNLKFMGIDSVGAFQSSWTVKARTLHRVPDGLSMQRAALIEPVAVACHDVRRAGVAAGEYVVVLGGGPIGVLIAGAARLAGARVLASEINPFRLDILRRFGVDALNPNEDDLPARVSRDTDGAGADVVFEVTASASAAALMTELPRTRGRIVAVGIYAESPPVNLHRFFWRELSLLGARLYEAEDYDQALALASSDAWPLDSLITGVYPLESIQEAFAALDGDARAMKTLIQCTPDA